MPKITDEVPFGGAVEKITRLGLTPLYDELKQILEGFELLVREEADANGGAAVRKMIDAEFGARRGTGWTKQQTGGVDWTKCRVINGTSLCIGVVPSDRLGAYLTDRGPRLADARRLVREVRVEDLPLILLGIEHDGAGPALAKQAKKLSGHPTTPE